MINFYLDDYNLIKTNYNEELLNSDLKVLCNGKDISFETSVSKEYLFLHMSQNYADGQKLTVSNKNVIYNVIPRFIVQTKRFDEEYKTDLNRLGCFIENNTTLFRLWSPLSCDAFLVLDGQEYKMDYLGKGLYETRMLGNKELSLYHYKVIRDKEYEFTDPFSYADKDNNSYVLDKNRFNNNRVIPERIKDKIIYEINVRDFSSDENVPFKYPKKLLALSEEDLRIDDKPAGIDYVSSLGITHIQIMPIFSFDYDGSDYNWGYNPLTYNTIHETYLVSDNPYERIEELKKVVDVAHKKNLRINLDVVFNHVYKEYLFNLTKMLPYYFLRYINDEKADGTFCGNETRSESYFLKEYILLIVKRLIDIYDIDGIRFDLMGVLDYETINYLKEETRKLKDDFMLYGEGWDMGECLAKDKRASINNASKLNGVGFFNGYFRDILRGENIDDSKAYLFGEISLKDDVKKILLGSETLGLNNEQSINYVECHDNFTLYDKTLKFFDDERLRIKVCKLALALTCLSKGIPFIHGGQEFLRSKKGIDNSYNSGDDINKIDWKRKNYFNFISEYLKDLISLRNKYDEITCDDVNIEFEEYYEVLIYRLNDLTVFINPCIFDHIYSSSDNYEIVFDDNGFATREGKDIAIPSFSVVVGIRKNN